MVQSSIKDTPLFALDKFDINYILYNFRVHIEETKNIITNNFSNENILNMAKEKADTYLTEKSALFGEDDDEGSLFEDSHDIEVEQYCNLLDMKNTVLLALTASLYHMFEKNIKEILLKELKYYNEMNRKGFKFSDLNKITGRIHHANFSNVISYIEKIGINVETDIKKNILILERLVNVYKHGIGKNHDLLSRENPEYYKPEHRLHPENLQISIEKFDNFAQSIVSFFQCLEGTYYFNFKKLDELLI